MTQDTIIQRTVGAVNGAEFSLVYIGAPECMSYIEPYLRMRIFGGGPTSSDSTVSGPGESAAGDLIVRVESGANPAAGGGDRVVLPLRVNFVADLRAGYPAGTPSPRECKRQRRRVARYGYTFEASTDPRDFVSFYRRMHLPTMSARHGERARSLPEQQARQDIFEAGFLAVLRSRGTPVAGVLCRVDDGVCHARLVGWIDGDPIHLEREALKTTNHFLLDWARREGLAAVDFQGCEPFLHKGTFQSKRHLGVTAVIPGDAYGAARISLEIGRDSAAVRDVLHANPAIAVSGSGELSAVYFHDAARPACLEVPYQCRGIDGIRLIDLDRYAA